MTFGNINIDKTMMPSYQIGQEYPTRQYQFMQDTLNNALNKQVVGPVQTQPVGSPDNKTSQWQGQ